MRSSRSLTAIFLLGMLLGSIARADDKASDDQFMAVGVARTKADLAVRKLKLFFDENDPNWRSASAGADAAHALALDLLKRAADDEAKKPDDLRDPAVMDALAQKRANIEQDWQKFSSVDRPNFDAAYKASTALVPTLTQLFNSVVLIDSLWKDAHLDLATLMSDYDAIGKRATDARDSAQKALSDLRQAQKTWQKTAESTTRPSGTDGGK